jgi:hypothetical protein
MEGSLVAYKVFTNGSTLQASELNENLMQQAVATFSNAAARTAAITSPVEGQMTYLLDVDRYDSWSGSAWIQVITPGAWIAYTPTLGNLTIGNGTVTARYTRIGRTVFANIAIVFGSTTAITGGLTVGLPLTRVTGNWGNTTIQYEDTGTITYPGFAFENPTNIQLLGMRASVAYVDQINLSSTIPFTWTTGDKINVASTYETSVA